MQFEVYLFLEAETVIDLNKIRDFLNDKVWKKCVTYEKYREKVQKLHVLKIKNYQNSSEIIN